MFHAVEKHRTAAKIILAMITFTFVGFGAYSLTDLKTSAQAATGPHIVSIGGTSVTEENLRQIIANQNLEETAEIKQAIFKSLVRNAYLIEAAKAMGFVVSEENMTKKLKDMLLQAPGFHDDKGAFSKAKFDDFLKEQNLTEAQFTKNTVDALTKDTYLTQIYFLFTAGQIQSEEQVNRQVRLQTITKQVHTYRIDANKYLDQIKFTDKDLQSFYDANKNSFVQVEGAKFDVLGISTKDPKYAKQLAVTDAEIGATKDERQAAHILIKFPDGADAKAKAETKQKAETVLTEVKATPDQFSQLAKKYSNDPGSAANGGDLGFFAKGMMVPEFEQKTFSMKKDEISGLVETQYGYHIIKLIDSKQTKMTDQEKAEAKTRMAQKKLQELLSTEAQKMQQYAGKDAAELTAAAKTLNHPVETMTQLLSRQQLTDTFSEEVASAMFTDDVLKNKKISQIVQTEDSIMLVVAREVRPFKQLSFAEAKDRVELDYKREQAVILAEKEANDLLAKLKKGEKTDITWSENVQEVKTEELGMLTPEAAKALIFTSNASVEKPAYLTSKLPAGAVLFKVVGEKEVDANMVQMYAGQIAGTLNEVNVGFNTESYLQSLESKFKEVLGTQPSPMPKTQPTTASTPAK